MWIFGNSLRERGEFSEIQVAGNWGAGRIVN